MKRNEPCHCGSGKRYKQCHGLPSGDISLEGSIPNARFEAKLSDELLRVKAEGYGRRIVSALDGKQRAVAVGGEIYLGEWRLFTDFLTWFARNKIWPNLSDKEKCPNHYYNIWERKLNDERKKSNKIGGVFNSKTAYALANIRLSYALYLIHHNDSLPTPLLSRLRNSSGFLPAALETMIAAAFVLSGFKIEMGETSVGSTPEGEFIAKKEESVFSVETKRRDRWVNLGRGLHSTEFKSELRQWIRDKIYISSRKQLSNPVFCLELSLPRLSESKDIASIDNVIIDTISECERELRIKGELPSPAYVIVTNHCYLASDDADGDLTAILYGFHINLDDKIAGKRDRHITRLMECITEVQRVPHSFDGFPDALIQFDKDAMPIRPSVRVGESFSVVTRHGRTVEGIVLAARAEGDEIKVEMTLPATGERISANVPMTKEERSAVTELGNAVFGMLDKN